MTMEEVSAVTGIIHGFDKLNALWNVITIMICPNTSFMCRSKTRTPAAVMRNVAVMKTKRRTARPQQKEGERREEVEKLDTGVLAVDEDRFIMSKQDGLLFTLFYLRT